MKHENILIVDNNADILDALAMTLGYALRGTKIQTAVNRTKAEEILRSSPIDLVMADLDMPFPEGYALIGFLMNNYPAIPLCVMMGSCPPDMHEKLRAMGVAMSIEKPFQIEALTALLREMMSKNDGLAISRN